MLVDPLIIAGLESDLLDRFANEIWNQQALFQTIARSPGFLFRDLDAERNLFGIMRSDFGSDAIFQRRDDLAARRVVFRVRRKYQHYVERQSHRIALNLHVAFLHDVEEANLDFAGEIGQLVDREDTAIRARQKAVVNREFVAEQMPALSRLDRIDVADDVGNGHVGCRELLDKSRVATHPIDVRGIAVQLDRLTAV